MGTGKRILTDYYSDRWLALLAFALVALGVVCFLWIKLSNHERILKARIAAPILLIHGLGGTGKGWIDDGLVDFLAVNHLRYGGEIRAPEPGTPSLTGATVSPAEGDVFVLHVSDSYAGLELWKVELQRAIRAVRQWTGAPEVTLVAFSAGGVAARTYLIDHPQDHGVRKLVTVASPHLGSELATLAERIRGVRDQPGVDDLVVRIEKQTGQRLHAPLLYQLRPPPQGTFLQELAAAPHPEDVEYFCVLSVGEPPIEGREELRSEVAQLRGGSDSRLRAKAQNLLMRWIALTMGEDLSTGDGAVLALRQDLGRTEFFAGNPEVVVQRSLMNASHLDAKSRYREILQALVEPPRVLRADRRGGGDQRYLRVDLQAPLGIEDLTATTLRGEALPVQRPVVVRQGDEVFTRIEIGPLREVTRRVDLDLRPIGSEVRYLTSLVDPKEPIPTSDLQPKPHDFRLHAVLADGLGRVDAIGGPAPELRAVLFADDHEVWRSRVVPEAMGLIRFEEGGLIPLAPRSQVRLELWDEDGIGSASLPEQLAAIRWNPGRLPLGRSLHSASVELAVDLTFLPQDRLVREIEPVNWE